MSVYFTQCDLQNMKIYPLKEEFGPVDIPEKNIKPKLRCLLSKYSLPDNTKAIKDWG